MITRDTPTGAMSKIEIRALAFLGLLTFLLPSTDAHGLMCTPRQRGAYVSTKCGSNLPFPPNPVIDYCAHCLNGSTVATVKSNLPSHGWRAYDPINDYAGSARRAGLCGDPKGGNDHMIGGSFMPYNQVPIVQQWKSGAAVDFMTEIDTNHNGYLEFFLCNLDACETSDISAKCFKNGHCHRLKRVPHNECEDPKIDTTSECGPVDPEYRERWYLPCRETGHTGIQLVGGPKGTMRYQLPKGVECEHCVVQWYYATGNSCAGPGFLQYFETFANPFGSTCPSDGGGVGAHRKGMEQCGGERVPEEFWSCADVQISANGEHDGQHADNDGLLEDEEGAEGPVPSATVVKGRGSSEEGSSAVGGGFRTSESGSHGRDKTSPVDDEKYEVFPSPFVVGTESKPGEYSDAAQGERENGDCADEHVVCNKRVRCCDGEMFCAYTKSAGGFTCRYWWSLWEDTGESNE